jgi:hypothetical protein
MAEEPDGRRRLRLDRQPFWLERRFLVKVKGFVQFVVSCSAGLLCHVAAAGAASIEVGSTSGFPGQEVEFEVKLNDMGERFAATMNDISVDASTPFASCERNPAINKPATTFTFQPRDCRSGVDCTTARALVLSFGNLDRIPNGSVLYTCRIRIAGNASLGTFPLTCSRSDGSDRDGNSIETGCTNGQVSVVEAPTTTPTPRPTPTATVVTGMLAAPISAESSSIPLVRASVFPDAGTVRIDNELIEYVGKANNELTQATRGAFLTTPEAHASGDLVILVLSGDGGNGGGGGVVLGNDGCSVAGDRPHGRSWLLLALPAVLVAVRRRCRPPRNA